MIVEKLHINLIKKPKIKNDTNSVKLSDMKYREMDINNACEIIFKACCQCVPKQ